jgi:hypothetical protein
MNVEGPMFVVERTAEPKYRFVILSRKSTERYYEDITPELELQLQLPYVMYLHRASSPREEDQIYGIWFYNNVQSINFVDLISRLGNPNQSPQQQPTTTPIVSPQKQDNDHATNALKSMLGVSPSPQPQLQFENTYEEPNQNAGNVILAMLRGETPTQEPPQQLTQQLYAPQQYYPPTGSSPPKIVSRVSPSLFLYQPNPTSETNESISSSIKELLQPQQFVEGNTLSHKIGDKDPTLNEFKTELLQLISYDDTYVGELYKLYMLSRKFGKM